MTSLPLYTPASNVSQSSTLVNQPPPAATAPIQQKPYHSTCASAYAADLAAGRMTRLEYLALTFSIMTHHGRWSMPLVVAIDENHKTLLQDCKTAYRATGGEKIVSMRITWSNMGKNTDTGHQLHQGNMEALLRLVKARGGEDCLMCNDK